MVRADDLDRQVTIVIKGVDGEMLSFHASMIWWLTLVYDPEFYRNPAALIRRSYKELVWKPDAPTVPYDFGIFILDMKAQRIIYHHKMRERVLATIDSRCMLGSGMRIRRPIVDLWNQGLIKQTLREYQTGSRRFKQINMAGLSHIDLLNGVIRTSPQTYYELDIVQSYWYMTGYSYRPEQLQATSDLQLQIMRDVGIKVDESAWKYWQSNEA